MRQSVVSRILLSFLAGALGVLAFHQGFLLLAYALSWVPAPPYSLAGTPPLGIPKVLSLAFWGGVWGIVMIPALGRLGAKSRPLAAVLFGGVLPTLVAVLVVVPLKGPAGRRVAAAPPPPVRIRHQRPVGARNRAFLPGAQPPRVAVASPKIPR